MSVGFWTQKRGDRLGRPWGKSEGRLDLRLGFVNLQVTSVEVLSVHRRDGGGRFVSVAVGDEGETTRAAGLTIHRDVDVSDVTELPESVTETIFGRVEGKITNVELGVHIM
jgi:hypothetical protein